MERLTAVEKEQIRKDAEEVMPLVVQRCFDELQEINKTLAAILTELKKT